jgi:hypothetical protein
MQDTLNKLVQSILQKNSVADCSLDELRSLTSRYPYFSTARLLLLQKLKQENNSAYQKERESTSLFINNPLWLDWLINEPSEQPVAAAAATVAAGTPQEKPFEDFNNDELVVENTRPSIPSLTVSVENLPAGQAGIKTEQTAFTFEPYHTVDYFASQGIKPVLEEKPADRFGQQLKSFTEWLKTLRQTPSNEIAKLSDGSSEEKVVKMAEHSIEDREIVTETMAEVWIRQGQPDKAVEVYNKLSLLDPSKSSYFADLIESLKKN